MISYSNDIKKKKKAINTQEQKSEKACPGQKTSFSTAEAQAQGCTMVFGPNLRQPLAVSREEPGGGKFSTQTEEVRH